MEIEQAIELFLAALARRGIPAPSDPAPEDDLAALANAIAPMRLPEQLVAVWRRFQAEQGALASGQPLLSVRRALEIWQDNDSGLRNWPRCLLPIGFEQHEFLWVELDGTAEDQGGRLWACDVADGEIRSIAPSLAELMSAVASAWDSGLFGRDEASQWSHVEDYEGWRSLLAVRFGPAATVEVWQRHDWPERWKALSGLQEVPCLPLESVVSIGQLERDSTWLDGRAVTVEGSINCMMMSGDVRAVIEDGTGRLEVLVPLEADPFADAFMGGRVQADIIRTHTLPGLDVAGLGNRARDAVAGGDTSLAALLGASLSRGLDPATADAVATAIRRVPSTHDN